MQEKKKRWGVDGRNRRRFLNVLSWFIPAFLYPEKSSCPFSPGWNCARFFERSDIIALLDVRAPSEHSRKASSSFVLSHSLAALFILFSDPCTSYSSLPFFFLLSANARRRNDFSGLCVSMTMVQNSARD